MRLLFPLPRRCVTAVPIVLFLANLFVFAAHSHAALPDWIGLRKPRASRVWTPKKGRVFALETILAAALRARVLGRTVAKNIVTEEIKFLSETDRGVPIEIFGYFSYPQNKKSLPAFIWIEGGLAPARTYRTIFGAKRGYATLAIDFPRPGLRSTGRYPINLGLQVDENPRQAPIYHGAVALLRAVSFLASRPEVDKNRIGMAGSSWGGLFTTLMTGLDPRLKVGACMFGTGNLQMGNMWWDAYDRSPRYPPVLRAHWRDTLDGANRLRRRKVPIAWFTGTNDWFFWMPSVDKTFTDAAGPKHLALLPNWDHALTPGLTEQTFTWLDIKGAPRFLQVSPLRLEKHNTKDGPRWLARWTFSGESKARRFHNARLMWSYGKSGNWHARAWQSALATRRGNECFAWLPASTLPILCSGTVVDKSSFRSSTPLRRVAPLPLQTAGATEAFSYDGCNSWGSYEVRQWDFLKRHHKWLPLVRGTKAQPARDGSFAARVREGETRLPMLHFTEGVRHRLTLSLRATKGGVPVVLETARRFNGTLRPMRATLPAKEKWTDYVLEWTPRESLLSRWNVRLLVPPGQSILLDRVRFQPVPDAPFLENAEPQRAPFLQVRAPLRTVANYRIAARPEIDDRVFWKP
jgi:dienelactone hydrolase